MGYQEQVFFLTGVMVFGLAGAALLITALVLVWGVCVDAMHGAGVKLNLRLG